MLINDVLTLKTGKSQFGKSVVYPELSWVIKFFNYTYQQRQDGPARDYYNK